MRRMKSGRRLLKYRAFVCATAAIITSLTVKSQTPVALYTFDNDCRDHSGHGNDGMIRGKVVPTMDRFGNPCGAYLFDGASGYIEVPSSPSLEALTGKMTITAWYRFNNKRDNYWLTALCKGIGKDERPDNPQFRMQVQQNLAAGSSTKCPGNANGFATVSLNTAFTGCDHTFRQHLLEPFVWSFFVLVYDGTTVRAYLNGNAIYEAALSAPPVANKLPLFIGMDEPGNKEYFDGALDDICLYDEALNAIAIDKLYREQRSENWDREEFTVKIPTDQDILLPQGQTSTKVSWLAPQVHANGCGLPTVTQIEGPASGSAIAAGRHLVVYNIESPTGYRQHVGFYINVGAKPVVAKASPPPAAPKVVPAPAPSVTKASTPPPPAVAQATPPVSTPKHAPTNVYMPPSKPTPVVAQSTPPNTYRPDDLEKRESIVQESIDADSDSLSCKLYDNGDYDGDTVSLFLNGKAILARQEVNPTGTLFVFPIDSNVDNRLVMYAENLGKIPPNTALLVINDGAKRHEIFLSSTLNKNAAILIRKRKKS